MIKINSLVLPGCAISKKPRDGKSQAEMTPFLGKQRLNASMKNLTRITAIQRQYLCWQPWSVMHVDDEMRDPNPSRIIPVTSQKISKVVNG